MGSSVFEKRVPASSVSPTFKLNLPSEVAAANLGRFLNTDFQLKKFGSDVSWKVSIAKRRNKDKHEYLLVGWRKVCEQLDVRCGDTLEFFVHPDYLEFSHNQSQSQGENDFKGKPSTPAQRERSTSSSEEMLLITGKLGAKPDAMSAPSSAFHQEITVSTPAVDTASLFSQDQLLDLLLDDNGDSLEGRRSQTPPGGLTLPEEPSGHEATLNWGHPQPGIFSDWQDTCREDAMRRASQKRRFDFQTSQSPWPSASPAPARDFAKAHSYPSARGWGDDGINKRPVIGFEVDAHSTGIRFNAARRASEAEEKLNLYLNAARNSEAENQQLRALLREEQERVVRAESRCAKMMSSMAGAAGILERQTSRGLMHVGAIFAAANRLVSQDAPQQMDLPVAHKLSASQIEIRQLSDEILDCLWLMRGLTKQTDVPADYVSQHALPHQRPHW